MLLPKKILILIIFISVFIEFFHPITAINQDLGRHIKLGEITLHSFSVPRVNLFSYTYQNFPFINSHWLSEVIFYIIFSFWHYQGLLVLSTLIIVASYMLIFFHALKRSDILSITIISILFLGILAERTDVRPEIFSIFFTALVITTLYKYREAFTRYIFILPFIELLWVNMHIYFIIGIVLPGIFLLEEIFSNYKEIFLNRKFRKHTLILFSIFIFTWLASLINPYGINEAIYPFTVFHNYGYNIQENQNIFFLLQYGYSKTIPFLIISTFIFFLCLIFNLKKSRIIDWLLFLVFSILAYMQIRNTILFVFVLFIPFSYYIHQTGRVLLQKINYKKKQYIYLICEIVLILCLIWQMTANIQSQGLGWSVEEEFQPSTYFFLSQHITGPIFNNFDIGSYLDYSLYPTTKVFIDGRPEAYPSSFFKDVYIPMQNDPVIFEKIDKKYHFNSIIFSHTDQTPWASQFIQQIMHNKQWRLVYLDSEVFIMAKNNAMNQQVIKEFAMTENNITVSNVDSGNKTELYKLSNFFGTADLAEQQTQIDQKILQIEPNNCVVLSQLITLYENNPTLSQMYNSRYVASCR